MKNYFKIMGLVTISSLIAITHVFAGNCVQWNSSTFQPQANMFGQIKADYGVYWLKNAGTNSESATPACRSSLGKQQCMQKLESAGYFDPKKPTIFFIHGWQPVTVKNKNRFDLCYRYKQADGSESPTYNTLQYWKGWNVAVFYWNQFADEDNVLSAESKIYSTQGINGMRWAYLDKSGQLQHCNRYTSSCIMPHKGFKQEDILDLAYDAYQNAFPSDYHPEKLRIAGQSLGTQVAIQLSDLVLHNKSLPQPTRVALMDPYFSPDNMGTKLQHLPQSVANYNQQKVEDIEKTNPKLPITVYRTSEVSFAPTGNPAPALMNDVAFMRLYPGFLSGQGGALQGELHQSSIYIYFESMKALPDDNPQVLLSNYVNAASPNQSALQLMHQKRYQLSNDASKQFDDTNKYIFTNTQPINPPK
jgi:hypothetical protein